MAEFSVVEHGLMMLMALLTIVGYFNIVVSTPSWWDLTHRRARDVQMQRQERFWALQEYSGFAFGMIATYSLPIVVNVIVIALYMMAGQPYSIDYNF